MRILTRYILREVTSHAAIGAAIFTFVLFTRDLGRILELVVRASAPLPSVAEIFLYTVPLALTYTIPMSVLVGILIGEQFNGTTVPLAAGAMCCGFISLGFVLLAEKGRLFRAHHSSSDPKITQSAPIAG